MRKTVVIDCFPENLQNYKKGYAIVAVRHNRRRSGSQVLSSPHT